MKLPNFGTIRSAFSRRGATGLIRSWLMRRLLEVRARCGVFGARLDCRKAAYLLLRADQLQNVKVVDGDLGDGALLEGALSEYGIATVFHLAAQTIVTTANRNPAPTFEANIRGTWTLLEACRHCAKVEQIVVASSDKAYGASDHLPYDESTPLHGQHPYGVSKSCADLIAQSYAHTYQLPVAVTRCGNVFGGGDLNWDRIVPGTIRAALRGEAPVIRSDGQFVRDYFYVEDCAAAYVLLAEKMKSNPNLNGEAFNFSNEAQVTVLELVERILAAMNSDLKPEVLNQASNEIRLQTLSAKKARTELGWEPLFSLDEGLERTIEWYRDFLSAKS